MVDVASHTSAYRPLGTLVYQDIRGAIVGGRFLPGERLVVSQLAKDLGVSRAPVSVALKRLQSEGFVEGDPHKVAAVAPLSVERIREVYAMRAALEAVACREAAERVDAAEMRALRELAADLHGTTESDEWHPLDGLFHRRLREASRMPFLVVTLNNLYDQCEYIRTLDRGTHELDRQRSIEEHSAILAALETRDGERVARLIAAHVERSGATFSKSVSQEVVR
ncbi:MAG TPA: GntR family transcriptional regulator [Chloroflexota bacterium]|nr:GntR family transcriptional regulator [Chloroflexota bacterium]